MTFLQPSVVHAPQPKETKILPQEKTTEISPIETPENSPLQDRNCHPVPPVEVLYDRSRSANTAAPIQPVELVVGLTPEEQQKKEEDPDLTLIELLGLIPCEGHTTTPLQIFDGLYVNQMSRFVLLAQEAQKFAKKLKEEEEASQWSGIPIEKFLNESFTKQLNHIQALQQIALLQCAREHLPQDIITILEHLGKVESTPFDKLYYLAQNCTDCYYTKVIQTFIEIIRRNTANRQTVLVNSAHALEYLGRLRAKTSAIVYSIRKVSPSP